MRVQTTRLIGAVALGGALYSSTACGLIPNGEQKAACDTMESELKSLGSRAQSQVSNPSGMAVMFTESASKIRSEGRKAGGDVEQAADSVADELDRLASTLRSAASSGNAQPPNLSSITASDAKLKAACT